MFILRASLLVNALCLISGVANEQPTLKGLKDAYGYKARINEESFNHESSSVQSQASHSAFSTTTASDSAFGSLNSSPGRKSPDLASLRDDDGNVLGHSFSSSKSSAKKSSSSSSKKVLQVTKEQSVRTSDINQNTSSKSRGDFDLSREDSSLAAHEDGLVEARQRNQKSSFANIGNSLASSRNYDETVREREVSEDEGFMDFLFDGVSENIREVDADDRSSGSDESDKSKKRRSSSSSSSSSSSEEENGAVLERFLRGSDESSQELNETDFENLSGELSNTLASSDSLIFDSDVAGLTDSTGFRVGSEHDITVSEKESVVTDTHSADYGDVVPQINELTASGVERINTDGRYATREDVASFNSDVSQVETNHSPILLALSSEDTRNTSSSESDELELPEIYEDVSDFDHNVLVPQDETTRLTIPSTPLVLDAENSSSDELAEIIEDSTVSLAPLEIEKTSETESPSNLIYEVPLSTSSTNVEVDTSNDVQVPTAADVLEVENVRPLLKNNEITLPAVSGNAFDVESELSQNVVTDASTASMSSSIVNENVYLPSPNDRITVSSSDEALVNEIPIAAEYTTLEPVKGRPYVQEKFPSKPSTIPLKSYPIRARPHGTIKAPTGKEYVSIETQTLSSDEYKSFSKNGDFLTETNNLKVNAGPVATRRPAYKPDTIYSSTPLPVENTFDAQLPRERPRPTKSSYGPLYLPKSSLPINLDASAKSSSTEASHLLEIERSSLNAAESSRVRNQRPFYSKNSPSELDYSVRPSPLSPYTLNDESTSQRLDETRSNYEYLDAPQPAPVRGSLRRKKYTPRTSSFPVVEGVESLPDLVKSTPSPLFSKPRPNVPRRPKYVPKPRLLPSNVRPHYDAEQPLDLYGNVNSLPQQSVELNTNSLSATEEDVSLGSNVPSYLKGYPSSTSIPRPRNNTPSSLNLNSSAAPLLPSDLDRFSSNRDAGIRVELDSYSLLSPVDSNTRYYPTGRGSKAYPRPRITSADYESDFGSSSSTSDLPLVLDTSGNFPYALASPPFPGTSSYPGPVRNYSPSSYAQTVRSPTLYSSTRPPQTGSYSDVSDLYMPSDFCPNVRISADTLLPKRYFEDLERAYEEAVCRYMSSYSAYPPNVADRLDVGERCPSYDVVIVGSEAGALGALKTFSDSGLRTLVIENGVLPSPKSFGLYYRPGLLRSPYAVPYAATMPGHAIPKTVYVPRVLGGVLSLDTNVWDRGDAEKYAEWSTISPRWSWSTASQFYRLIERVAAGESEGVPVGRYAPESEASETITRAFAELGVGRLNYSSNEARKRPGVGWLPCVNERGANVLYAQKIFEELRGRENVHLALGTEVVRINFELDRAVSVDVVTPSGNVRTVRVARELILGGEPVGTVKLLYRSGVGDESTLRRLRLPVQHHLPYVGKQVSFYPTYVGLGFRFPRGTLVPRWESDVGGLEYVFGQYAIGDGLAINNYLKVFLRGHDALEANVQLNFFVFSERMATLLRDYANGLFDFDEETRAYVLELCRHYDLLLVAPQLLDADSKGAVSVNSSDYRAAPVVNTGMYGSERDMKAMLRSVDVVRRVAETKAFVESGAELFQIPVKACGPANFSNRFNECSIRRLSVPGLHLTGGAIMGKHRSTSVVDENLTVHGTRNVRVFSSAVIPYGLSADSAAPSGMIGRYGAYLNFKKNSV